MKYPSLLVATQGLVLGIAAMATFWANESFHAAYASNVMAFSAINLSNAQQLLSLQMQLVQYCQTTSPSNSTSACNEILQKWDDNIGSIAPALAAGNSTTLIQIMTPSAHIETPLPADIDTSGKSTGSIVGRFFVIGVSGALGLVILLRYMLGDLNDGGKF